MVDVVYIDDEVALVRATTLVFNKLGLVTRGFSDPREALEFIAANDVRLVLCDYRMPTMNGLQVLDALGDDVSFYLISGDLALELDETASSRIAGRFSKPISPRQLALKLKECLE